MEVVRLEPVERVSITILVDNLTDPLLQEQAGVSRQTWGKAFDPSAPHLRSSVFAAGGVPDPLLGEPGFSALVRFEKAGTERTLLFDTGVTPFGMVENMRRLGLSLREVELIVLSHGHWDHVTGMEGVVRELGRSRLPVLIHPEFWSRRRVAFPSSEPRELPSTSRSALEGAGFEIIEQRQPSFLLDRSVLVTGEVDRTSGFEQGMQGHQALREHRWEPDPLILDDQALLVSVRDRGLVVLTGCGHAGIINTIRYAQRLSGESQLAAVIGGFHLSGRSFEPIIEPTVQALDQLAPTLIAPAHCTGWKAVHALAQRFPNAYLQCAAGTTIEL
jgi:7,8-dihydropterin-6-yl-methyl-4-(beta-D-ribofuranosyl)aminobenzene 5'-phosphate synthase